MSAAAVRDGRTPADRAAGPLGAAAAWTALAFLLVPMAVVVAYSFSASRSAGTWGGFFAALRMTLLIFLPPRKKPSP